MEEPRKQDRRMRDIIVLAVILLSAALIVLNTASNLIG